MASHRHLPARWFPSLAASRHNQTGGRPGVKDLMRKRPSVPSAMTGVQMGLIITPMLDMSFQILSFFVMTYHPSALEGHIDGNLLPPKDVATASAKVEKKDDFFPPVA